MSVRVPESPLSASAKSSGSHRLAVKIARSVTYQWLSGRRRRGPVLSAPETLAELGFKNEYLVSAPSRANSLCCRLCAEIDAELKTVTDRPLILTGGLRK
jgi:hypothetical protein